MIISMSTQPSFVPASEAAYIGGISLRDMNRLADEDLVPKSLFLQEGGSRRFARLSAAFAKFFYGTEQLLVAGARKQVLRELTFRVEQLGTRERVLSLRFEPGEMNWKVVVDKSIGFEVDVAVFVTDALFRAKAVDSAAQLVTEDAQVMGGRPCFTGTRVPIDNVLASLDKGISKERLLASYPFLTAAHFEAARVYQQVHPRRGRPRLRDANPPKSRRETRVVRAAKP